MLPKKIQEDTYPDR